ncbi:predicted transcriptional regulator [Chthonomonas calidirosea]|nr:predicted transcriptional regulator [Chthonomonas calidirosea]
MNQLGTPKGKMKKGLFELDGDKRFFSMESRILECKLTENSELFQALASETRLRILQQLADGEMNISELQQVLGVAHPSVSKHIQVLEQAGLIVCEYRPGVQGMQKRCRLRYDRIIFSLESAKQPHGQIEEVQMPVGLYTIAYPKPTCGLASSEGIIGFFDDPQSFFLPERAKAQILWMADGFVEYVFPNNIPTSMEIYRVELSLEICSECPDYNNDYPSDITLWINGVEVGTWTSPGDFGGHRGRLNPSWWNDRLTQHGMLKIWSLDQTGSYVDGVLVSETTIDQALILPRQPITVRIGIKPDAKHVGGFNLFGRGFGNYEQDLLLRMHYHEKTSDSAAPSRRNRRELQESLKTPTSPAQESTIPDGLSS